jgi:hypothetical protein
MSFNAIWREIQNQWIIFYCKIFQYACTKLVLNFIGVNMKSYTNQEINDLAGSALDVACSFIQEQLNVETGDLAGLFFSGNRKEIIESIFEAYIRSEIGAKNET